MIRPASAQDIAAIFEIRTGVRENHLSMDQLAALGITPEAVAELLPCTWVAEHEDRVVGFAIADDEEGSLFALFVRGDCEGLGIGRALLRQAETFLFAAHPSIWLETSASSRAAAFYQRAGWEKAADLADGDLRLTKTR